MSQPQIEPWLRGPIEGIPKALMPIAHSLMQVIEDLPAAVEGLSQEQLNAPVGGARPPSHFISNIFPAVWTDCTPTHVAKNCRNNSLRRHREGKGTRRSFRR